MENCQSCGAALTPAATWCGQCYAVVTAAGAPPAPDQSWTGPSIMSSDRTSQAAARSTPMVKSRWKKSQTTFGPAGRIACTVALVVPFLVFVLLSVFTGGLIIAAPVIWGFVIMPWGLKDTWRAGMVPAS